MFIHVKMQVDWKTNLAEFAPDIVWERPLLCCCFNSVAMKFYIAILNGWFSALAAHFSKHKVSWSIKSRAGNYSISQSTMREYLQIRIY